MKKWDLLEKVEAPNGTTMSLHRHDEDFAIRVDGRELMSTRRHASEERMAEVVCAPLILKPGIRVLIGGLGLGFTLKAALANLGKDAEVIVAELMPPVITWNKNEAYPFAAKAIADSRVTIEIVDVYDLIRTKQKAFDVILLDADNNTTAMNTAGNKKLFQREGLTQVYAALKKGGSVVYWSADSMPLFAKEMGRSGFKVDVERARAHTTSGGAHTLLIGKRV